MAPGQDLFTCAAHDLGPPSRGSGGAAGRPLRDLLKTHARVHSRVCTSLLIVFSSLAAYTSRGSVPSVYSSRVISPLRTLSNGHLRNIAPPEVSIIFNSLEICHGWSREGGGLGEGVMFMLCHLQYGQTAMLSSVVASLPISFLFSFDFFNFFMISHFVLNSSSMLILSLVWMGSGSPSFTNLISGFKSLELGMKSTSNLRYFHLVNHMFHIYFHTPIREY